MNIVHVLSGLTKGGGERMVLELSNQSAINGNKVTIIAGWPENPELLQCLLHPGIEIKFVSPRKKTAYLFIFSFILKNRRWLAKQDILHCHLMFGYVFGASCYALLKKFIRSKSPMIIETNHAVGMPVPKLNRWIHSRLSTLRDGIVIMAEDPYWNSFVFHHKKIKTTVIKNGVSVLIPSNNSEYRQRIFTKFKIPPNALLVGSISMLRPDRNPILYVPIFKKIFLEFGQKVHFLLGGTGAELDNIQQFITQEGLQDNFHLIGLVKNPPELISLLDAYVSISVGETAGISMIEAAMCRVPVTGIQVVQTYQPKEEDWVWSHTEIDVVAKKLIELLRNAELRLNIAEKQYKHVNTHFTAAAMYHNYEKFYKEILGSL